MKLCQRFLLQTTKTDNLPYLFFVWRKPEDFGTEMKAICDTMTDIMIALEIQRAKEDNWLIKYMAKAKGWKTAACLL